MSQFLWLNVKDLTKATIVTVLSAFIWAVYLSLQSWVMPNMEILKEAGIAALIAWLWYLSKNLMTNSDGKFFSPEVK